MADRVETILALDLPLIVEIGRRRMSVDDVVALGPGAILELNKSADDELEVLVNNKHIGKGNAVKVGENFGVRISQIGTARERIEAMGQDD